MVILHSFKKSLKLLLKILKKQKKRKFKYIKTLDESWYFLKYQTDFMYAPGPESVIPKVSNTISSEKVNLTIAFSGEKIYCLKLIPSRVRTNQQVFIDVILKPIVKKFIRIMKSLLQTFISILITHQHIEVY